MTKKLTATTLVFKPINKKSKTTIAVLTLNRPDIANAFNKAMIEEIRSGVEEVAKAPNCRALILQGAGKHLCAGADLTWMKEAAKMNFKENVADAANLTAMFEALSNLEIPTIAIASGAVFGGGVGLVACCDIVIALQNVKFCLSEVKIGIIPAVILPYLARKITRGQLLHYGLSAKMLTAEDAYKFGLAQLVTSKDQLPELLQEELKLILSASGAAQKEYKKLLKTLEADQFKQSDTTKEAIAKIRQTPEAQAGMAAFLSKQTPAWSETLATDWVLNSDE
jgi:methylglutaconyl-CoA hydratase